MIGVNSQIESESGGNVGIGFAIPSNTIRSVADQLVAGDNVEHAYLGVSIQTPETRAVLRSEPSRADRRRPMRASRPVT